MLHRLYFSPGFFGFGRLASYDYFVHLRRALSERLQARGEQVETHVVPVAPTASIRRRAVRLAELVASTCEPRDPNGGPIHLIGHSTGGLDARLVASPSVSIGAPPDALAWRHRLKSITTINTPHFGTPLASFFTTANGERVLRALTALTVVALSLGSPPLAAVGALVAVLGRADRAVGLELKLLDRATDGFLRVLDDVCSREVRDYLNAIRGDQGAMVQLMPEAMDLFAAGIEDDPRVLCQSTVSMAPSPGPRMFLRSVVRPWELPSTAIFAGLYGVTSRQDPHYPCTSALANEDQEAALTRAFERAPHLHENDGVVPIRSQLWGKLVWAGYGDHLDVLGHFADRKSARPADPPAAPHVDWLHSGSGFDRLRFASLVDAIAEGVLAAVAAPPRAA